MRTPQAACCAALMVHGAWMNFCGHLVQLGHVGADEATFRIELFRLRDGIEDAEPGLRVAAGGGRPLPAAVVGGEVEVEQPLGEPGFAQPPVEAEVLAQEAGGDHAQPVVHPAAGEDLRDRSVDERVAGAAFTPGGELRLGVLAVVPADAVVGRLGRGADDARVVVQQLLVELAPGEFAEPHLVLDKQEKQALGYDERVKILQNLPQTEKAHGADFQEVNGSEQLNAYYQRQIEKREEGIVLHDLATHVAYKVKPKFNLDLAIVGYVEGTEELTGNVAPIMGALVCDNSYQLVARVGVADPALRERLFQELSLKRVAANYTETDSDGRPIHWVRPVKVMEINGEDAQWNDTDGKPWTNTVLQLVGEQYHYRGQGFILKPFHPTLERIREDKAVHGMHLQTNQSGDVQLKQSATAKPPKIFLRQVFSKTVKGNTGVRKIVAWEQEREDYPRFVLHTVDYSPGRAKPLEEATKATDREDEARQFGTRSWKLRAVALAMREPISSSGVPPRTRRTRKTP